MAEAFIIRAAEPADAPVISVFNQRLAWETERRRLDEATIMAGVTAVLTDAGKGAYYVAEVGGRVIGQCSITFEWSDWRNGNIWWLQSVYVDAAWRARGVFRALFEAVQSAACAAGVVALRLYVEADNTLAQEAYRRRGMGQTNYRMFELELPRESAPQPPGIGS